MGVLDSARDAAARMIEGGRDKTLSVRRSMRRRELMRELGELHYRQHAGESDTESAIVGVLDELDQLAELDETGTTIDLTEPDGAGSTSEVDAGNEEATSSITS